MRDFSQFCAIYKHYVFYATVLRFSNNNSNLVVWFIDIITILIPNWHKITFYRDIICFCRCPISLEWKVYKKMTNMSLSSQNVKATLKSNNGCQSVKFWKSPNIQIFRLLPIKYILQEKTSTTFFHLWFKSCRVSGNWCQRH